jgi:type I restriction enzyme S subunit
MDNMLAAGNPIPEELEAMAEKRQLVPDSKKLLHTNPALAAQFPSAFEYNEVLDKWVPEGWEVKKLQELVNVKYGKDHKKLGDGLIPCYGSGGVMRFVNKALFESESILIPRKGTLDNVMYVNKPFWSVDTMFYTVMNQENFVKYFFYVVNRLNFSEMNEGSAVPSMTTAQLNSMDILLPSSKCLSTFESLISKYFSKKEGNEIQSETLTQLRDRLLPELISGRVRVNK